eukprot:3572389-Rhodomonas_salina.1
MNLYPHRSRTFLALLFIEFSQHLDHGDRVSEHNKRVVHGCRGEDEGYAAGGAERVQAAVRWGSGDACVGGVGGGGVSIGLSRKDWYGSV